MSKNWPLSHIQTKKCNNDNCPKIVFKIGLPLQLYNLINQPLLFSSSYGYSFIHLLLESHWSWITWCHEALNVGWAGGWRLLRPAESSVGSLTRPHIKITPGPIWGGSKMQLLFSCSPQLRKSERRGDRGEGENTKPLKKGAPGSSSQKQSEPWGGAKGAGGDGLNY